MPLCSNSIQSLLTTSTLCRIRHSPRHLRGKAAPTFRFVLLVLQEQNVESSWQTHLSPLMKQLRIQTLPKGRATHDHHLFLDLLIQILPFSHRCSCSLHPLPVPWPRCHCLSSFVLPPARLPYVQAPILTFPSGNHGT